MPLKKRNFIFLQILYYKNTEEPKKKKNSLAQLYLFNSALRMW
jgi:hypothetical protein